MRLVEAFFCGQENSENVADNSGRFRDFRTIPGMSESVARG
jgi:hypothetical protein